MTGGAMMRIRPKDSDRPTAARTRTRTRTRTRASTAAEARTPWAPRRPRCRLPHPADMYPHSAGVLKVRVNTVCPGAVRDDTTAEGRMLAEIARALDVPVHEHEHEHDLSGGPAHERPRRTRGRGRHGRLLASDKSRRITGSVLTVDGGFSAP